MAHIAYCRLSIAPMSDAFAADIAQRLVTATGETDVESTAAGRRFVFFGRWTCEAGWAVIEELLNDPEYAFREELLAAEIDGRGSEPACAYREAIKKFPGRTRLQRKTR